jgi:hypothetical protein
MHLPLDDEIIHIERRIAGRKHQLGDVGRATGKRALDVLASPVTIAGALAVGFAVGGGLGRRRNGGHHERRKATASKTGSILGLLMSGAMWLVRAQFGGPAGLARVLADKFAKRKQ